MTGNKSIPPSAERCGNFLQVPSLKLTCIVPENGWLEDDFFFSGPMFFEMFESLLLDMDLFFCYLLFSFCTSLPGIHHSLVWDSSPSCTPVWEHVFFGALFPSRGEFLSKCQARTSLVSQMQRLRRKQRRRRGGNKGQQLL